MAKQLNIDMSVRADTSQAKKAMMDLQKSLDDILSKRTITIDDTSINQAKQAAMDLKHHLAAAADVNTGKLDLSKFSASLNKSGQSLQGLYNNLSQIGPEGQSAFLALSQSIAKADASAISLGGKLGGLMTTLKNTAKWQLSSSLLHGFMGALQGAYGYAQDLNQSLNNIRIVTGQNIDQMAQFAKEANNAAKALSTTTTEYTNASLIYYQQGLSDAEVKARTDTTIKLANVSRQSAEEVSSQMTAIWNNFADGAENLEYYADVITKLGATTASSSSEIAQGLEKFAAVSDTVGLSYEKASAALATVVAETRQSADVVGTSFRTLFSRIEGLKLGKTLEDGVDLNKYSEALNTVGVKILDANKQIKSMDNILDELGAKWDSIGKSEQVALAQTVGGARQYTQFISLMDNYDKVLKNQSVAENSTGTIQEQADIYAESWEAAIDRVTAAAEEIYDQLLNDEAFIDILDGFEKFLEFISNIIDGLGGLKGVLLLIGSIFMQQYAKEMPAFIEKMTTNVRILTGEEEKRRQVMLKENADIINNQMGKSGSAEVDIQVTGMKKVSAMYADLASKRKTLSQVEIASYENLIKETEARTQVAQAIGKQIDEIKKETDALENQLNGQMGYAASKNYISSTIESKNFKGKKETVNEGVVAAGLMSNDEEAKKLETLQEEQLIYDKIQKLKNLQRIDTDKLTDKEKEVLNSLNDQTRTVKDINKEIQGIQNNLNQKISGKKLFETFKTGAAEIGKVQTVINHVTEKTDIWTGKMEKAINNPKRMAALKEEIIAFADEMDKAGMKTDQLREDIRDLGNGKVNIQTIMDSFKDLNEEGISLSADRLEKVKQALVNLGMNEDKLNELQLKLQQGGQAAEEARVEIERMAQGLDELPTHTVKISEGLTQIGSTLMQVSMAINSLKNLGNIWSNEDLSAGEKLLQTMTSLGMVIPIITTLINKNKIATLSDVAAKILHISIINTETASMWALLAPIGLLMAALAALVGVIWLIVKAFQAWQESTPEGQLKKAEENAKALADAVKEAKDRAEELKSTFDSYHEVIEKLKTCVKGTQEWRDTLQEVNTQVLDLIEKYPELAKYITTDSDGVMNVNSEGEKLLTERLNNAVTVSQIASIEANRTVREKNINVIKSDMDKNQALVNGINQSDKVNSYISKNQDRYANMADSEIRTDLQRYFSQYNMYGNLDSWIKSIDELTSAVKEDSEARKAESSAITSNLLANNQKVQNSTEIKQITDATTHIYNDIYEKNLNNLDRWGKDQINQLDGVNDAAKKVWKEYLEAANLDPSKYKLTDTTGNDENRKFVYTDENGDKQEITLEEMKYTKAAADALKDLDVSIEQIVQDFQKLSFSTNKTDQALEEFLANKNFESTAANEISNFSQFVNEDGTVNTSSITDYLTQQAKTLGYQDLETMAKTYGFETGEAFVNAFGEAAVNITTVWDNIDLESMGLSKTEGWAQNLSYSAANALSDNFRKIKLGPLGEEAAKAYVEGISDMLEGIKIDDQKAALEDLTNIDWSDYDAFDKAVSTMKKYGKTLDENDPKWNTFIADMRKANNSTPDFSKLNNDLTSLSKILGKLNFGDVIESEDYIKLISYKSAWEDFFIMQADGTRKFIGNANAMKEAAQDSIRDAKEQMIKRKSLQDNLRNDSSVNKINWNDYVLKAQNGNSIEGLSDTLNNSHVKEALNSLNYEDERISQIFNNYQSYLEDSYRYTEKEANEIKDSMFNMLNALSGLNMDNINFEEIDEKLASTASNLNQLSALYEKTEISAEAYDKQLTNLAMSANSLSELKDLQLNSLLTDEDGDLHGLDIEEYGNALIHLAENYDNCTNEILEYQKALASGSGELVASTQAALENAIAIGEMSKALDLEVENVEEQAKELVSVNNLSETNYKIASKVAVLNQTMNKGVKDLVDNWADYKKTLQTAEKGTEDYANAALKTKKTLAQLLGVLDEDYIPENFLELPGVMELIDKAAQGDEDAINSLGATMAKATIEAMQFKDEMKQLGENDIAKNLDTKTFIQYQTTVLDGINTLIEGIENGTIRAGEDISTLMGDTTESWIKSLNQMAYATGMSVEEMNSLLNELGVQADVTVKDKEVETSVPEYTTYEEDLNGSNADQENIDALNKGGKSNYKPVKRSVTVQTGTKKVKGSISVAQINMGNKKGTPPTITYAGRDNVSSSALTPSSSKSNSSGTNSTTKSASHTHEVNRYSNEENAINGLSKTLDRLSKAKDKAFGADRVKALENELQTLKQLKNASTDYLDAIAGAGNSDAVMKAMYQGKDIGQMIASGQLGGTIGADYRSLLSGASASGKSGVEYTAKDTDGNEWLAHSAYSLDTLNSMFGSNLAIQLDTFGNILNKDSLLNWIQGTKNNIEDAYSRVADPTAASQTLHNEQIAYLEEFKERLEQYDNTAKDLTDKVDERLEYISQIQEKNAEIISTKLNNKIELGDTTLRRIERVIKVLGDDMYKSVEAMILWQSDVMEKFSVAEDKASANQTAFQDIQDRVNLYNQPNGQFNENAISPSQAADMIREIEDSYDNLIDDTLSNIETLREFYGNTLDYWKEKIDETTKSIEQNSKQLEHYQKMMDLLGRSKDYDSLISIAQGQVDSIQAQLEAQDRLLNDARDRYEENRRTAELITNPTNKAEFEQNTLKPSEEYFYEMQDSFNAIQEQFVESVNNLFNALTSKVFADYENNITNGLGFDELDKQMERAQSLADEYLTKTNQIYETNTLMRKLSQDIDKTDSRIAKDKLKAFSDEIAAMQKQEKLSKTELEIAKARYEVLQAEIALREAQNAKSTVRLQRDSEGNYGYVYTADRDKIDQAEQNLADKQNDLYNLSLEKTVEYRQKISQLEKERMAEEQELIEQYANGQIESEEELRQKMSELDNYYNQMELSLREQYYYVRGVLDDAALTNYKEAWTEADQFVLDDFDVFRQKTEQHSQKLWDIVSNMDSWRTEYTEKAKLGNTELTNSISKITAESQRLSKQITQPGGTADAMNKMMIQAKDITLTFSNQYSKIKDMITGYQNMANKANSFYRELLNIASAQERYNTALRNQPSPDYGSGGGGGYSGYSDNNVNTSDGINASSDSINNASKSSTNSSCNKGYHNFIPQGRYKLKNGAIYELLRCANCSTSAERYVGKPHNTGYGDGKFHGYYTKLNGKELYLEEGQDWKAYKTGGYTGSWNGPNTEENGKLAFLHQKELVLNADDTENVLNAVKLIRQISETIDLQAAAAQNANLMQALRLSDNNQVLQQEVTIHAEFPNAVDHNEIEEAFDNLINRATQYANRS